MGEVVDGGAADGDFEQGLPSGSVVVDLQLEDVVKVALGLSGEGSESAFDLGEQVQEFGVRAGRLPGCVVGVEFVLESGAFSLHLVEPLSDGSAVRSGGVGGFLADVGEFVHEAALFGLQLADLGAEGFGAVGEEGLGPLARAGELGGEQFVAVGAEDAVGEEVVDSAEEGLFADPHALGVGGEPGRVAVVGGVDLTMTMSSRSRDGR
ncbi:hypothetical protein [Streptomyces bluensis]|uniref:hypothetical protein n=1 Tax=Streptomyces bluensis TaxID=33897 RepID=UPI00331CF90A